MLGSPDAFRNSTGRLTAALLTNCEKFEIGLPSQKFVSKYLSRLVNALNTSTETNSLDMAAIWRFAELSTYERQRSKLRRGLYAT
jgi:hypothetical protein